MKKMRTFFLAVALFPGVMILPRRAWPAAAIDTEWKQISHEDDLTIYERHVQGSDLLAFKGKGSVAAPLARVAEIVLDAENAHIWIKDLVSARIIRWLSPTEYITYNHIGTPFVIKDRDFVSHVQLIPETRRKRLSVRFSATMDAAAPPTDYVRGELLESNFEMTSIQSGAKTEVEAEIHVDPKGSVPKWIVNLFQRGWPRDTFKALRGRVARTDIAVTPVIREMVGRITGSIGN